MISVRDTEERTSRLRESVLDVDRKRLLIRV